MQASWAAMGREGLRIAESFVEAYALGSTLASLVCVTGMVIVPRIRARRALRQSHRRLAQFLAEAAAGQVNP